MRRLAWLVLLLLAAPASASSVLLVPEDEKARSVAEELIETFGAEGVTVKLAGPTSPAVNCLKAKAQRNGCLADLEGKAKVDGVVVMGATVKGPKVAITFELLSGGESLRKESAKGVKGKLRATARPDVAALMKALKRAADEPETTTVAKPVETPVMTVTTRPIEPKVAPADAPKPAPVLTPTKPPLDDELALREKPKAPATKSRAGAWVVTGLAVVAAGAAATLGAMGASGAGQLATTNGGVATVSYADAEALRDSSNAQLTAALGLGIGAGVAGLTAGILWGL